MYSNSHSAIRTPQSPLLATTRRHFFGQCAVGIGAIALNCLLEEEGVAARPSARGRVKIDPAHPLRLRISERE
jgi:hypothetical protein